MAKEHRATPGKNPPSPRQRAQAVDLLRDIARGVSAAGRDDFFRSLVLFLARKLDMEYAFVGELIGDDKRQAKTLSVCVGGTIVDNFQYPLYHTPCENVMRQGPCIYSEHVRERFPQDPALASMRVESYAGAPLFGSAGLPLGLLVVMDRKPLRHRETVEGLLQILAVLAAAELERTRSEEEMRKLTRAIQQTADAVVITDRDGVIEYVNQAFVDTSGYSRAETLGKKPNIMKSGMQDAEFYRRLWETILAGGTVRDVLINRRKNGELYYEEKTITPLKDAAGKITHFISTGKDITDRMQVQERLHHLAHHDVLTDLPNRVLFIDRLQQALIRAHWHKRVVGVMFLDLDRFKNINDTLGHDTGDRLLKALATRLRDSVREGDTVARLGGDEFAILLEDVAHVEDISGVARKVLNAFAAPFVLGEHEFYITTSIGVSLYPNDGADATTLLKHADTAMYRAKDLGRNNYQFYSADMSALAFERLTLETSLRRALERHEFVLHFQPQVDLKSGLISGMEALLRWQHPEFGMIAPLQFISIAEETGLIVPIGEWVLKSACDQARTWQTQGQGELFMAINLSGRQFNEPAVVDTIRRSIAESGLREAMVELEITEGVIMQNAQLTIDRLRALHAVGVRFAIDDFGTGYSSLSYLRRFPLHTLKIDKSFIQDIPADQDDAEIVKTIIAMAHGLRLRVVAEGVETPEQLAFLRAQGCDAIQGYYFSRPLPAEEATRLLHSGKRL
jgi:diguanylate cyclase (GGDEF)-like protein/PAS domain S-box-containing protein